MTVLETYGYALIAKIIVILSTVASIVIAIYHRIVKCTQPINPDAIKPTKKSKALNIIQEFCIISAAFFCIINSFAFFGLNSASHESTHIPCYITYIFGVGMYAINKCLVYYTYFLRLQVAFGNTIYKASNYLLSFLYISTTIYFLTYLMAIFSSDKQEFQWNDKYDLCISEPPEWWMAICIILTEFFITICSMITFVKPLLHLKELQNDRKFHDLVIKIALCNSIMMISSVIGIAVYSVTASNVVIFIDNVINPLCLMLMLKIHQELYTRSCNWCISFKCCEFQEKNDDIIIFETNCRVSSLHDTKIEKGLSRIEDHGSETIDDIKMEDIDEMNKRKEIIRDNQDEMNEDETIDTNDKVMELYSPTKMQSYTSTPL